MREENPVVGFFFLVYFQAEKGKNEHEKSTMQILQCIMLNIQFMIYYIKFRTYLNLSYVQPGRLA